jgi:hypothetical protein
MRGTTEHKKEGKNGYFYNKLERTVEERGTDFLPGETKQNHELLNSENSVAK